MEAMKLVVDFNVTDAAIAELKQRFSEVPDAETKEGYARIKQALKELVPYRTGVEKKRKEINKDAVSFKKKVDSEAKRITEMLLEIESPLQEAKKAIDNAAKIAEQKRIEGIQNRIDAFKNTPLAMLKAPAEDISQCINDMQADECSWAAEFVKEALSVRNDAVANLVGVLAMKEAASKAEAVKEVQPVDDIDPFFDSDNDEDDPFDCGTFDDMPTTESVSGSQQQEAIAALVYNCGIDEYQAESVYNAIHDGIIPGVMTGL